MMRSIGSILDLQTKVREDFTITEKAPTWAFKPTSTFTFKNLLRHYANWALTDGK